LAQP